MFDKKEYGRQYYQKNKEKMREMNKKWIEENSEKYSEWKKDYQEKNKEKLREYNREYYKKNKDQIIRNVKKYRIENIDKIKTQKKKYREDNKDKIANQRKRYISNPKNRKKVKAYKKSYYEENKEVVLEKQKNYVLKRLKTDPIYKLQSMLRRRVLRALNGESKNESTIKLLGCSIDNAKKHIESQFKEGMTWENHGKHGWHIDHIAPCASFDLSDPEQQKQCFNYKNLQPLWAEENMRKGAKTNWRNNE